MRHTKRLMPVPLLAAMTALGIFSAFSSALTEEGQGSRSSLYYIVREGDCLWKISERLYQDPLRWPLLWQNNPYITDPHWIYPGDPIYLGSDLEGQLESAGAAATELAAPQEEFVGVRPTVLHVSRRMTDVGLITEDGPQKAGAILAGPDERVLLSFGDQVVVQFGQGLGQGEGARYQILRPVREVKHPASGERIGTLHRILGSLEIEQTGPDRLAKGRIVASQEAIEVGDWIRKGDIPPREVASKPAAREVTGTIVATLGNEREVAQHQVCFIDRGIQDGIEPGDEFWVFQSGKTVKGFPDGQEVTLPDRKVGTLVVVQAESRTSTALVAQSSFPLFVGDRVKSRTE